MKLASFDIFDTTLIRKCGKPENIFYLLAWRLYPANPAKREAFLLWRRKAELAIKHKNGEQEITLDELYAQIDTDSFPEYSVTQLKATEKLVESENLQANPNIRKLIEDKRMAGYCICFVSDMYLDSEFLTTILLREGCMKIGEPIYVSCEHNARKSNGKLFKVVREQLHPSSGWEHYGDHPISDVKMPQRLGIKGKWVDSSFSELEKLLLQQGHKQETSYELSILTGLQRMARIQAEDTPVAQIAVDYIVPAYIPYVRFVLQSAHVRGLRRLYFLSRDSYILIKIAERMQADFPDIELKYLFVSRKALLLPYLTELTPTAFLAIQDHRTIARKNVNALLESLRTSRAELSEKYGISFEYERIWGKKEETDFLNKIFDGKSAFYDVLRKKADEERLLLTDYFRQEGLLENIPSGMVDVGWLGTSRLMINSILQKQNAPSVDFYYYGIRQDVLPLKYGNYISFCRPEQLTTELTTLIENYFSASPYPSTVGYKTYQGRIIPIFAKGEDYRETEITQTNVSVAQYIVQEMAVTRLNFEKVFWNWMQTALEAITYLNVPVPLEAFSKADNFDNVAFVRRINICELFRLLFLGEHITAFDRGSLMLTCGSRCYPMLWKLHSFTGRLRRYLYIRFAK